MQVQIHSAPQLLFFVSPDPDGGFVAKAPNFGIFTQGDTLEELIDNIKDAIYCHFDEDTMPSSFSYQIVKREMVAL